MFCLHHYLITKKLLNSFRFQAQDLKIRLGEWDVHREDEFYPYVEKNVEEIFIHPNFVPRNLMNDVALLKLDTELDLSQHPHISPICLPPDNIELLGRNATVTGWGRLSEGHNKLSFYFEPKLY